ncbi:MAG: tRNA lysidine(34) synthetase TilS [Myxococcota bacterium]
MTRRLRERVGEAIRTHGLWSPDDRVAVAVSGGVDSVVLLDLLVATARWHRGRLEVVTIDHRLRPDSADDAAFVAGIAADRGLGCRVIPVEVTGPGEAAARDARYLALAAVPVDRVALAHHADDVAETVLVNLMRGTGLAGLAAIRWRRDRYVRPLLEATRDEIRGYAIARGLDWREDPTNRDPRYLRNRIRREVIPLLDAIRPGASAAIARTGRDLADDEQALRAQVPAGAGPWTTAFAITAPPAIVRRALATVAPGIGPRIVTAVIRAARRGSGRIPCRGGGAFVVENGAIWFHSPSGEVTSASAVLPMSGK